MVYVMMGMIRDVTVVWHVLWLGMIRDVKVCYDGYDSGC